MTTCSRSAVAYGLAAGAALYAVLAKWLQTVLYGVPLFDATSLVIAVVLIFMTCAAGIAGPLLRTLRIDPVIALRAD